MVSEVVADGDGDDDAREDEEEGSDDFFDAGEDAIIGDRLSLRAASERGQSGSGGGTKDDPVGPVAPRAASPNTIYISANRPQWTFHARYQSTRWTSTISGETQCLY